MEDAKKKFYISIVIPVYNEEKNIALLVDEIKNVFSANNYKGEIVFVDDGSIDESYSILLKHKNSETEDLKIRIVKFRRNCGQTAAFDAGFKISKGDVIITMDADLQNNPQDIPKLLEQLSNYDVVCGVRVERQDSLTKKISSNIGNAFRNFITNDNIIDTGCSLKAFKSDALKKIKLYKGLHRFLPTLLKIEGYKVCQVPVSHRKRLYGKTKYGIWKRLWSGVSDCFAVRWMKKRHLNYEIEEEV